MYRRIPTQEEFVVRVREKHPNIEVLSEYTQIKHVDEIVTSLFLCEVAS